MPLPSPDTTQKLGTLLHRADQARYAGILDESVGTPQVASDGIQLARQLIDELAAISLQAREVA